MRESFQSIGKYQQTTPRHVKTESCFLVLLYNELKKRIRKEIPIFDMSLKTCVGEICDLSIRTLS